MMDVQKTKILNCDNLKQKKRTNQEKQKELKIDGEKMEFYLKEMPETTYGMVRNITFL